MNMNNQLKKAVSQAYKELFANKRIIPGKSIIPVSGKVFDEKEMLLMVQAVLDGWWTEGKYAKEFEEKFCSYLGRNFCVLANSGSSANLLAISALTSFRLPQKRRLKKGDEVITTAAGFPTTINPIIQNNLMPVFVDIDLGTYNTNLLSIKKAISQKTKAIFLAHTLGNPWDAAELREICDKQNIWLIEDNCDALGSKYNGQYTGTYGHLSTFSFYPAHHITMGEGGAITTDDPLLDRIIRSMRDWGRDCWCKTGQNNACGKRFSWKLGNLPQGYDHKYIYSEIGYNLKLTDIQAALGVEQLRKLPRFIESRRKNFAYLRAQFEQFQQYFILPQPNPNSEPSWFGFPLTIKEKAGIKREDLLKFLEGKKIDTRLLFGGNILKQPYFSNYKISYRKSEELTGTDIAMKNTFWIGVYPGLGLEHFRYVISCFKEFFERYDR